MPDISLETALNKVDPDVPKWASVIVVTGPDDSPIFTTHNFRDSETSIDFWPASVVKLYTCVASCELLNELGFPTDVLMQFNRADARPRYTTSGGGGKGWRVEAASMFPEMCSNIFRESTNDDYTMQLRFVGLDRLNGSFFTKANGFAHTALMRGYVHDPPHVYERQAPQRVTVSDPLTGKTETVEHTWSGTSYAEKLGAHVLDSKTGNCSPTADMAECLRRVMFHEVVPSEERFKLTEDQLVLLREGRDGYTGLRNTHYAYGYEDAADAVFPDAAYYHKSGSISNYQLDLGYLYDRATNTRFIMALATESREKDTVRAMGKAVAEWVRGINA